MCSQLTLLLMLSLLSHRLVCVRVKHNRSKLGLPSFSNGQRKREVIRYNTQCLVGTGQLQPVAVQSP